MRELKFLLIFMLVFVVDFYCLRPCERKISSTSKLITAVNGKSIRNISCIAYDSDSNLYIGTSDKGIFVRKKGKWKNITSDNGLSHDSVHAIVCDIYDDAWVGTAAGLNHIKRGKESVETSFAESGFKDNIIHALETDDDNLYIGTTKGLTVSDLQGNVRLNLTVNDGLPSNIINAIHSVPGEGIYIGTSMGLAFYYQGSLQVMEKFKNRWITCIASSMLPKLSSSVKKTYHEKVRLFYKMLKLEINARAFRTKDPAEKARYVTAEKNVKHMLAQLTSSPSYPIFVGTSDGCFKLDHEKVFDGDVSLGSIVSTLWTTGVGVDRNRKPWIGSKNGCLNSSSNVSVFSDQLDGFEKFIRKNSVSVENQEVIDTNDIISVKFDYHQRLITGIQGIGLYTIEKVLINHDAAYYAMMNKGDAELSLNSQSRKLPPGIMKLCSRYAGFIKSSFPNCRIWIGRFMDLDEDDIRNYARVVGRYGHPACMINLSKILLDNPIVMIPYE